MTLFGERKNRHLDEFDETLKFHQQAEQEFDDGVSFPDLRARMLAEANHNTDFARTRFIEERVSSLQQEKYGTAESLDDDTAAQAEVAKPLEAIKQSRLLKKYLGFSMLALSAALEGISLAYFSVGGTGTGSMLVLAGLIALAVGLPPVIAYRREGSAQKPLTAEAPRPEASLEK